MNETKLLKLLGAWADDTITDAQIRELDALLTGDPEAQRTFAEYMAVNAELEQLGPVHPARGQKIVPFPHWASAVSKWPVNWRKVGEIAATVAFLGIIGAIALSNPATPRQSASMADQPATSTPAPAPETIVASTREKGLAILTHTIGAAWAKDEPSLRAGAILGPGKLRLDEGLLHLQFFNGVKLVLQGPAEFELMSLDEGYCWQGRFHASVPPHAQGFVIHTPTGELIDHGTDFGLEVGPDGSSEVHVFNGEVEFRNPGQETVAQLAPGEAARIDEFGRRLPLLADQTRFASDKDVMEWHAVEMERQFSRWYQAAEKWKTDPGVLAFYDFDSADYLTGEIPAYTADPFAGAGQEGVVIGARVTNGRWPSKGALEFSRPSDRVRVRIPGYHDSLTLTTWVRIDRLEKRDHGLLISDGSDHGSVHWEIDGLTGMMKLETRRGENEVASYASAPVFHDGLAGQWEHLACVYDRLNGQVIHYLNAKEIGRQPLSLDVQLRVGVGEIGNRAEDSQSMMNPKSFIGDMDEFIVFDRALSQQELAAMVESGEPG